MIWHLFRCLFARVLMVRWLVRADHLALPPLPQPEARGAAVRDLAPRHQLPLLPQDGYVLLILTFTLARKCQCRVM